MPAAIEFVQENRVQLQKMTVAYFLACLATVKNEDQTPEQAYSALHKSASYMAVY